MVKGHEAERTSPVHPSTGRTGSLGGHCDCPDEEGGQGGPVAAELLVKEGDSGCITQRQSPQDFLMYWMRDGRREEGSTILGK